MKLGPLLPLGYLPTAGPPNTAGLPLWLDGFDIDLTSNSSFANNDPIGTWKNKGSQGATNDPVQAVGAVKPTFKTSGINGHPAALFTATKYLAGPLSAVASSAARHVFAVVDIPATPLGFFYIPGASAAGSYGLCLGGDSIQIESDTVTTNNFIPAAPATGLAIVEYSFDGVTTNNPTFVISGVSKVVTNGVGTGVGTETALAGTIIGNTSSSFVGYIGEILSYNAVQSAGNVTAARAYLSAKWGISA